MDVMSLYDSLAGTLERAGATVRRDIPLADGENAPVAVQLPGRRSMVAFSLTPPREQPEGVHLAEIPALVFTGDEKMAIDFALATILTVSAPLQAAQYFQATKALATVLHLREKQTGMPFTGLPSPCLLTWNDVQRAAQGHTLPALTRVTRRLAVEQYRSWRRMRIQARSERGPAFSLN